MNGHILLAEDDNDLRDMIARTLRKAGYEVAEAANGQEAVNLLTDRQANHPMYDIVLTDIVMGEIDGIEVMHVAREQPDAPEVILLTGHGSLETAIEAVRLGAFDYLLKPSPKEKLLDRIQTAMDQRNEKRRNTKAVEIVRTLADFATRPAKNQHPSLTHPTESAPSAQQPAQSAAAAAAETEDAERYMQVGLLSLDTYRKEVWFNQQLLHTTPIEYLILESLAQTPGRVVTFSDIVRNTHNYTINKSEAHDLLRTHIRNLRKKLDRRYIVSVYATGYMLVNPEEEAQKEQDTNNEQ
jgi:DNA-binding response OmpR family regulator